MANVNNIVTVDLPVCCCAGQEAFELHSKDMINDSTYLLLSSLSVQTLRTANIIKALAINFHLARPDKDPGSFVSSLTFSH